jgi:hypothetical protein
MDIKEVYASRFCNEDVPLAYFIIYWYIKKNRV